LPRKERTIELPDIVWIVFDTARADSFTSYGATPDATPVVASLARDGFAVPHAFSTANWTLPAHASMFTGLLPRELGLGQAPGGVPAGAKPALRAVESRYLPALLRQAGYRTVAVSANGWVSPHTGFDLGFDEFHAVSTPRQARLAEPGWRPALSVAVEALRARVDDGLSAADRAITDTLRMTDRRQPLFLFINLVECHSPYLPPHPYNPLGPIGRIRAGLEARRYLTLSGVWTACAGDFSVPPAALARMRTLYAQAVRSMDDWLGKFVELFAAARNYDESVFVITSDHGENFGEGQLIGHALSIDDRLMRVPLVVRGMAPDALNGGAVSLTRLPWTIAQHIGLPNHPWSDDGLAGIAVAQQDGLCTPEDPRLQVAIDVFGLAESNALRLTKSATAAHDGYLKLVVDDSGERVYDLTRDPLEEKPLTDVDTDTAARAERLRAALRHPSVLAHREWPAPAEPTGGDEEDEALRRSMEILGYM
jgi:arylsulfatase A-like enzyme